LSYTATLDDLDDPLQSTSDRAPLTGNIGSRSGGSASTQNYLTSTIGGEDRRAPTNTIDETVWETLSRDLLAIWEKLKQVMYPKYLLGGLLQRGGGIGAAERGESEGFGGGGGSVREWVGRWPDADVILQGGMSEGLRDWDLWGPLIFCLLLSFFLSRGAKDSQKDLVFSGIFAMVWIGEAVVTLQIKLLGGNMYVPCSASQTFSMLTTPAPSSSPSASSATRSSPWSSPRCSAPSASLPSPGYLSTSCCWPGRWQRASASWAGQASSGTVLESQYTPY
jgi:hypothetical protein